MISRSKRRENSSSRRRPQRDEKPVVVVLCGGRRTEPDYFNGLRRMVRNGAVNVIVMTEPRDPESVVKRAAGTLRRKEADEAWCVLDVDDFRFDRAVPAARKSGVNLAVSNPCFEVWLILHHADLTGVVVDAKQAIERLRKYLPKYDKARMRFDQDFAHGVEEAIRRGRVLLPRPAGVGGNPSTGVWPLVEVIRGTDEGSQVAPDRMT